MNENDYNDRDNKASNEDDNSFDEEYNDDNHTEKVGVAVSLEDAPIWPIFLKVIIWVFFENVSKEFKTH